MRGYFNKPTATAEAIDTDGWFHTGDIGEIRDGFLAITDRKKDIIVTAGGKKIAPQPIESKIKTNKYVSQAVMIGDRRKYPVVLIVPNWDQLEKWAKLQNILWTDRAQLLAMPTVHAKMEKEVFAECAELARFEMPKKVGLLDTTSPWSAESSRRRSRSSAESSTSSTNRRSTRSTSQPTAKPSRFTPEARRGRSPARASATRL